jgi:hypothetical protein
MLGLRADLRMVGALVAVLIVGAVARSLVTLTPPLVVGDDDAYYLVQVRAILRGGVLAIPDFPLLSNGSLFSAIARPHSLAKGKRFNTHNSPRPPQAPAASFKSPYRKCSGTTFAHKPNIACRSTSDRDLS